MRNISKPNSLPKTYTRTHVSPLVWKLFMASLLFFIASFFFTTWTSTGPIWTSPKSSISNLLKFKDDLPNSKAIAVQTNLQNPTIQEKHKR
jgi:signal transduction histidine kinase